MQFKDPWILLIIPFIILYGFWISQKNRSPSFRFSSTDLLAGIKSSWKIKFRFVPMVLRLLALIFFVVALAGPRKVLEITTHKTEGIDIVLALDCSGSMAAEDFQINGRRYNRLMIIKNVVKEFIAQRTGDRIGLIAFAGLAYTACPLTTDYDWLLANLDRIQLGVLEDGTAIGSAINSSLNRLKNTDLRQSKVSRVYSNPQRAKGSTDYNDIFREVSGKAKSRIIILLTDGMNNAGKVDPITAAKIAYLMKVKIYTIGAGSKGLVPFPVKDFFGQTVYQYAQLDLDEDTLKEIARITNGQYFRATDTESLRHIYKEINSLEKIPIEETGYKEYKEFFGWFLLTGIFCLVLEVILSNTIFMRIP